MDSGAQELVTSCMLTRENLGAPSLRPAQVRLRSATSDDMGLLGSVSVRRLCNDKLLELTALVATRAARSLCSALKLLRCGYEVEMKPTHSAVRHRNGGSVLLRRSSIRDFLVIRVPKTSEVNNITFFIIKCEVESLKSELCAPPTSHLSTSEVRLPWIPHDNICDSCVTSCGISRHPLRVYSESCAFNDASGTFKEAKDFVTVLTGRGPRCECFCRVVPRKGQRLKKL